jgi:biopolymer transport protein ExbD
MQSESVGRVVAVPNVTPMIDVMLVLLIIFMVVTPTLTNGVIAEPPVAENLTPHPEQPTDHMLAIDARGALYLDKLPVTEAGLGAILSSLYPAGTADRVLYVRAHRELSYGAVNTALDIARANGVAMVGLISEQKRP